MYYFCLKKHGKETYYAVENIAEIPCVNDTGTDKKCKVGTGDFYKVRLNCSGLEHLLIEDIGELRKLTKWVGYLPKRNQRVRTNNGVINKKKYVAQRRLFNSKSPMTEKKVIEKLAK